MRRLALPFLIVVGLTACTGSPSSPAPKNSQSERPDWPPPPDAPIPTVPATVAASLQRVSADLEASLRRWAEQPPDAEPPTAVVLLALYQQRTYGTLAAHPGLARKVVSILPTELARTARADIAADRDLGSLGAPSAHPPKLRTIAPRPAGVLMSYFRAAERRFHVAWQVLAAVNFIESKFGRVTSASSAGAQGPMQFIPSTWKAYGLGGDIRDPRDAIMGAANYLSASGAPGDYERALFEYNPSDAYVRAVLIYARQMSRDPLAFYAYYNWQVFVATTSGDRRITGPGL